MYLILPRESKENKLFLNKRTTPLESKLTKIEKITTENGKTNTFYHYNVFVEIDKRVAIEKNIQNISVEISNKSLAELNNREALLAGVDTKNTRVVNLLATNADTFRINATISNKQNNKTSKVASISSDEVFDNRLISKIKNFKLPDSKVFIRKRKRYVLKSKLSNSSGRKKSKQRSSFNFIGLHQNKGKQKTITLNPGFVFKKKYNKILKSGGNPADFIQKSIARNNQSSFDFLKGRINKMNKRPSHLRRDGFTAAINNITDKSPDDKSSGIATEQFELILEESSDRNAILKQSIKINERHFLKLKKGKLRVIFIAKDNKNVSFDVTEGFLNHFEEKKKLSFPSFDFEALSSKNYRGDIRLQIKNNDNRARTFNVYALKKVNYTQYENQEFILVKQMVKIQKHQSKTLFKKTARFNDRSSIFFRVNLVHDGIEYSNSKFISSSTKTNASKTFIGGIIAKCDENRNIIEVKNLPVDSRRVQVIKRNLSKKELKFALIKTSEKKKNSKLTQDTGKIIIENSNIDSLVFVDDDVEENNVYEYKIRIYDENGSKKESANSFIDRYVKKTGFLNLTTTVSVKKESFVNSIYSLHGSIKKNETDADKVFKDLFGRFYDLFEEDLKEIKDLNAMSYDLLIEVYSKTTSEPMHILNQKVDKDGKFKKDITLPSNDSYVIKVTPRAMPPAQIIAKINNSMPLLAQKTRFAPVSTFNTAAIKKIARRTSTRVVSNTGIKYSERANRKKGKIIDRGTFLNRSDFDMYFDGETGDNVYVDVSPRVKKNNKAVGLTTSNIRIVKKEKSDLENYNQVNFESGEEKYLASFGMSNLPQSLDFLIMSFSENGNISTSGMAYCDFKNLNENIINYVYSIPNTYGKIDFYAQPVIKNGSVLSKIKIGTILKDDTGTR